MDSKRQKKLCWNCEGELDRDAQACRYCGVNVQNVQMIEEAFVPTPPYSLDNSAEHDQDQPEEKTSEKEVAPSLSLKALLFFFPGIFFFLFSLFLLFFSEKGTLTLKWESSYWAIYFLMALPLLFLGYRKAKKNS